MHSSTLPLVGKSSNPYRTRKEMYHISFASECQRCSQTCVKPRRLPCEHEFCKACLKEYFNSEVEDDALSNTFPCPACHKPTQKPLMPKARWTKAYKLDSTSLFYTAESTVAPVKRRSAQSSNRLLCKLTSEQYPCAFWGGDVCPDGNIFLPDWYNHTIKVFNEKGTLLAFDKLLRPPLDVTMLLDHTLIVSYGRVARQASLIKFEQNVLGKPNNVALHGNLYSTTRLGKRCLGILELDNNKVTLATLGASGKIRLLDIGVVSASIATSSGVCYQKSSKRIFLTHKHSLLCLDSGGKLIFEKSYPLREKDHHVLGSVTCDQENNVFIASENGILHVDSNGEFLAMIRPCIDPFHIMVSRDCSNLYVVGRFDKAEICPTGVSSAAEP